MRRSRAYRLFVVSKHGLLALCFVFRPFVPRNAREGMKGGGFIGLFRVGKLSGCAKTQDSLAFGIRTVKSKTTQQQDHAFPHSRGKLNALDSNIQGLELKARKGDELSIKISTSMAISISMRDYFLSMMHCLVEQLGSPSTHSA